MSIDYTRLRIEGVYKQNEDGLLMMRVKIPAGVLSSEQALKICDISDRFSDGSLHLTTRGSIELHWLQYADLVDIQRMMASVGLTSRGACGGAVRGIVCSTTFSDGFAVTQVLSRKLHRHFAGNPHFEGLPKKFKIGVDAGYEGARHLIQDFGLVYVGTEDGEDFYDVWTAGGLGRAPQEAFLLEEKVPEERIVPLAEAVVRVYRAHTPAGKRLKHLLNDMGEKKFRRLLADQLEKAPALPMSDGFEKRLTALPHEAPEGRVEAVVFAGEIGTGKFRALAKIAVDHSEGFLALTADQNVALLPAGAEEKKKALEALAGEGFDGNGLEQQVPFRICPGNHACRMGLAPTRDVAKAVLAAAGTKGRSFSWAISGCSNSCAQPQLADAGILVSKLVKDAEGKRSPLFDLLRREEAGFGRALRQGLSLEELLQVVSDIG